MDRSSHRRVPYVSLQMSRDDRPRSERHLAAGRLISPSLVVIPSLPRDLTDLDEAFEVVIASGDGDIRRAEVIRASHIEAHGLDQGDLAAFVYLERPSTFPVAPTRRISGGDLVSQLQQHDGQLGRVLNATGYAPATDADNVRELLHGISVVRPARHGGIDVVLHPSIDELAWGICLIVPWCEPPDPGSGP
jgi:hypothetical protein